MTVNSDSKTIYNQYINYYLLFAFGIYNKQHIYIYSNYNMIFQFFIDIKKNTSNNMGHAATKLNKVNISITKDFKDQNLVICNVIIINSFIIFHLLS